MTQDEWVEQYCLNVGARGSDAIPETPCGLNGPTGAVPFCGVFDYLTEQQAWVPPHGAFMVRVAESKEHHMIRIQNEARIAALEAEYAELRRLIAFSDPTPGDRPDPPRRPDGTLAPAPKPWTPPKEQGPSRRVGA